MFLATLFGEATRLARIRQVPGLKAEDVFHLLANFRWRTSRQGHRPIFLASSIKHGKEYGRQVDCVESCCIAIGRIHGIPDRTIISIVG